MNDTIDLKLNLPVIGGILTAFFKLDQDLLDEDFQKEFPQPASARWNMWSLEEYKEFKSKSARKYYKTDWQIAFKIRSSDGRYNPGRAIVLSEHKEDRWNTYFDALCRDLSEALDKMNTLAKQSFSGSYSKIIGESRDPKLEVIAENKRVYLNFWISSNTRRFAHELDIETTEKIIEKLKLVPEQSLELMISLEELCSQ